MTDPDQLAELLYRCAQGDERAFAHLYKAVSPRLYGQCLRLVGREDLAQELLQEGFVRIWRKADRYSPAKGTPMTWMIAIVRNRALDHLRWSRARPEEIRDAEAQLEVLSTDPGPEQDADTDVATRAVLDCLGQLDESQRRCVLLAYYYGYSHEEMARLLGRPLGTVKAWVRRGMERLRQCLG